MSQLASGPVYTTQQQTQIQPTQWVFKPRVAIGTQPGFDSATRQLLEQPFAPNDIKHDVKRHTDGWDPIYVDASTVLQRLNDAFNSHWSFEMLGQPILMPPAGPIQVIVHGRLTVQHFVVDPAGHYYLLTTTKEQFGSCFLKQKQGVGFIDLGADFKAAATDALKKCATQFGIALDLYNRDEAPMQGMSRTGDLPAQGTFPAQQVNHSLPAEEFQINAIRKMFADLGIADGVWQQTLQFTSPAQITQGMVQALLSGVHPWVAQLRAAAGQPAGLRASAA